MHDLLDTRLYAMIGEEGFARLVRAFYRRVETDDILAPMYRESVAAHGETLDDAERRLRDFLVQRFGGPPRYSEARGHPRLRARHMAFMIDQVAAQRWVALMRDAADEVGLPPEARELFEPFVEHAAAFLVNS